MMTMGTLLIPDAEIIIPNRVLSMRVPSDVDDPATGRIPGLVEWLGQLPDSNSKHHHMAESYYSMVYGLFGAQSCSLPCAEDHIEPTQRISDRGVEPRAVSSDPLSAGSKITSASFANSGIFQRVPRRFKRHWRLRCVAKMPEN